MTNVLFQQKEIPNEPNKSTTNSKTKQRAPAMRLELDVLLIGMSLLLECRWTGTDD